MSEIVKFTEMKPVSVELEDPPPATHLQVTLTATSIVTRDMFVLVSVSAQDRAQSGWFTIPPELGRVALKAGQPLAIPVTVDIPAKTPFDRHGFKVVVADDASQETDFSEKLVTVERKQKVKDNSWWKWVAVGVGCVAVVAIAIILLVDHGGALGDSCDPAHPNCGGGVCPTEVKKCVAVKGVACKQDDQCISKKCSKGTGTWAPTLLGDVCYPSYNTCEGTPNIPCPLTAPNRCVSDKGGPCKTRDECLGGACTKASGMCGLPVGEPNCAADAECPVTQVCVPTVNNPQGKTACLYRGGVLCPSIGQGGQSMCVSQICNIRGQCAPQGGSCVPEDQDCAAGESCVNKKCVAPGGGPVHLKLADYAVASPAIRQFNANFAARSSFMVAPKAKQP